MELSLYWRKHVYPWLCILGCLAWCFLIICIIAAPGAMMFVAVYKVIFRG